MNKGDLVERIAKNVRGVSKRAAGDMVDEFCATVAGALRKGENVTLSGFGTFSVSRRAARAGRNPRTGAEIKIPARRTPKFAPGAPLKAALNHQKTNRSNGANGAG